MGARGRAAAGRRAHVAPARLPDGRHLHPPAVRAEPGGGPRLRLQSRGARVRLHQPAVGHAAGRRDRPRLRRAAGGARARRAGHAVVGRALPAAHAPQPAHPGGARGRHGGLGGARLDAPLVAVGHGDAAGRGALPGRVRRLHRGQGLGRATGADRGAVGPGGAGPAGGRAAARAVGGLPARGRRQPPGRAAAAVRRAAAAAHLRLVAPVRRPLLRLPAAADADGEGRGPGRPRGPPGEPVAAGAHHGRHGRHPGRGAGDRAAAGPPGGVDASPGDAARAAPAALGVDRGRARALRVPRRARAVPLPAAADAGAELAGLAGGGVLEPRGGGRSGRHAGAAGGAPHGGAGRRAGGARAGPEPRRLPRRRGAAGALVQRGAAEQPDPDGPLAGAAHAAGQHGGRARHRRARLLRPAAHPGSRRAGDAADGALPRARAARGRGGQLPLRRLRAPGLHRGPRPAARRPAAAQPLRARPHAAAPGQRAQPRHRPPGARLLHALPRGLGGGRFPSPPCPTRPAGFVERARLCSSDRSLIPIQRDKFF